MVAHREYAIFLQKLIALVICGVFGSVLFVVVTDPYHIYSLIDRIGFNHIRPRLDRYQVEIKMIGAQSINANTFILGNSRAEIGFDPDNKMLSEEGRSSYNLAIAGSGLSTTRRQVDYLQDAKVTPKLIILGLDFFDFLYDPNVSHLVNAEKINLTYFNENKWKFDVIFSLHSVLDAIKTLQIQHKYEVETITSRGFNPLLEYNKYAREEGYYALFQQRAEENAKNYILKRGYAVLPASDNSAHWSELRSILKSVSEEDIELYLVIYPYHAQILLMLEHVGLWPAFEQWKIQLIKELAQIKIERPQSKIHLWDFSGFSSFQCEIIPSQIDKMTVTQWYWEAGHFKSALGDIMLTRILDTDSGATHAFGYLLNLNNIAENSQRISDERQDCMTTYPKLFFDVNHLFNKLNFP